MQFWKKLFAATSRPRPGKAARHRRLQAGLEPLEQRQLLAIFQGFFVTTSVVNGDLYVEGTEAGDNVLVENATFGYRVTANGQTQNFWLPGGDVFFYGRGCDDNFENRSSLRATADGGAGNDLLTGGTRDDYIL